MSEAPRTIWALPCQKSQTPLAGTYCAVDDGGVRYHHDDVMRELAKIASHALDQWESCIESDYAGTSGYDAMIAEVFAQRAALAKLDTP